jgi:sugar-specific transcriptional regulator TrmB
LYNVQATQTLMDLGLTFLQARTYLALFALGTASIKEVSKTSNIAKQDIYRIMPALEKMGLVEKQITTPTTYIATPIKNAFSVLIEKENKKLDEIKKKADKLSTKLLNNNSSGITQLVKEEYFAITCEEMAAKRRFNELIKNTQITFDNMAPWKNFVKNNLLYAELVKKGLEVRAITEEPRDSKLIPKNSDSLNKNPLFECRVISTPALLSFFLFDKKYVALHSISPLDWNNTILWTNCKALAKMATDYFEEFWTVSHGPKSGSLLKVPQNIAGIF